MKKVLYSKKEYIILLFVTILICLPFIVSTKYIESNYTDYHISNIYAINNRLNNGSFESNRVLPIIGNDYGYGSGIFYPSLTNTIPAYLSFIFQGNIILALKLFEVVVYFLMAIVMYKLLNRVIKNKQASLFSAISYIIILCAITNIFKCCSISELSSFIFIPMVFYGLYELFNGSKRKFFMWFVIGYVALINTHLTMTVCFTILVLVYLFINIKKVFTLGRFSSLIGATTIVILLTLPFTASLLDHCFIDEYYIFNQEFIQGKLVKMIIPKMGLSLTFVVSIVLPIILIKIPSKKYKIIFISIILGIGIIASLYGYSQADYKSLDLDKITSNIENDTGCLPIRTIQNMNYFLNRGQEVIIRRGNAIITPIKDNVPDLEFKIENNEQSIIIELPRIYYLGYDIKFNRENNETQNLKFYMNENGFIETRVMGNGTINVTYGKTPMEDVANKITLITLIIIMISFMIYKIKYVIFKNKNIGKVKLLPSGKKEN